MSRVNNPYRTPADITQRSDKTFKYHCWVSTHPLGFPTEDDGVLFTSDWFVICWIWGQYTVWMHPTWAVCIQTKRKDG